MRCIQCGGPCLAATPGAAGHTLIPIRVCVESPFKADNQAAFARNIAYADACMWDSLHRGEAPFLGHLQYPRVLDDTHPDMRELGIAAHCAWLLGAEFVAAYVDLGITAGMDKAISLAHRHGISVVTRELGKDPRAWNRGIGTPRFASG